MEPWNMFAGNSSGSIRAQTAALKAESDVQEVLIAREIAALRDELDSLRSGINFNTAYVLAASELMDALVHEASAIEQEGEAAIRLSDKSRASEVDVILANSTDVYLQEITGGAESMMESDKVDLTQHGRFSRFARRIV